MGVTLLISGETNLVKPVFAHRLNPIRNKTGRVWHCSVSLSTAPDALSYAYRVEGPSEAMHRFDSQKVLLDAFAEQVFFPPDFSRVAAMQAGANDGRAPLEASELRGEQLIPLPFTEAWANRYVTGTGASHDDNVWVIVGEQVRKWNGQA